MAEPRRDRECRRQADHRRLVVRLPPRPEQGVANRSDRPGRHHRDAAVGGRKQGERTTRANATKDDLEEQSLRKEISIPEIRSSERRPEQPEVGRQMMRQNVGGIHARTGLSTTFRGLRKHGTARLNRNASQPLFQRASLEK